MIDLFVDPSSTGKYLDLSSAFSKRILAEPESDSVEWYVLFSVTSNAQAIFLLVSYPHSSWTTLLSCASPQVDCYNRSASELPANRLCSLQNPEDPGHLRIALAYKTGKEWFYVRISAQSNDST
jgi:hypothetical protein